jgi:hypothetical protein
MDWIDLARDRDSVNTEQLEASQEGLSSMELAIVVTFHSFFESILMPMFA